MRVTDFSHSVYASISLVHFTFIVLFCYFSNVKVSNRAGCFMCILELYYDAFNRLHEFTDGTLVKAKDKITL